MATKKQKREAGRIRHEQFKADERARGLEAQKRDRERRAEEDQRIAEEVREFSRDANARLAILLMRELFR